MHALEMATTTPHKKDNLGPARKNQLEFMPTLFRFVVTLAVLAVIVYGVMVALVMFVEPKQAELSVRIPAEKLNPQKP